MATVSITIPDALIPRLTAAMRAQYPQYSALTDVQTFKAITADQWKAVLASYEAGAAESAAKTKAAADAAGIG